MTNWDHRYAAGRGFTPVFADATGEDSTVGDPSDYDYDQSGHASAVRLGTQMANEMSGAFMAQATAASARYAQEVGGLHEDLSGSLLDEAEVRASGRFGLKDTWKRNALLRGVSTNEEWRFAAPPPTLGSIGTQSVGRSAPRRVPNMAAQRPNAETSRGSAGPEAGFVRQDGPRGIGPVGGGDPHGYLPGYQSRGSQFNQFQTPALGTGARVFGSAGVGKVHDDEVVEAELVHDDR